MIRTTVYSEAARERMERIVAAVSATSLDPVMEREAWETLGTLVEQTPKRTGQTRRYWKTSQLGLANWMVTNTSKVMRFLELGTRAHGPRTAKALYIPLRLGAMVWHPGLVFGKDYVLAKRVRGIRARNIVKRERPRAQRRLRERMVSHIMKAVEE